MISSISHSTWALAHVCHFNFWQILNGQPSDIKFQSNTTQKPTVNMARRGVHRSSLIGLRGFFDPTHYGGSKNIQPNPTHHISLTQSNPTYMGRVGSSWMHGFDKFLSLLLLLNWVEKKYKYKYIKKKPKD